MEPRAPRLGALVGGSLVAIAITVPSTRRKRDSADRGNYAVRLLHSQHAAGVSIYSQPAVSPLPAKLGGGDVGSQM